MPLISSLGVMNAINFGLASSSIKKQSLLVAAVGSAIKVYPFSTTGSVGTLQGNVDTSSYWTGVQSAVMSSDAKSVASTGSNSNTAPFLVCYPYSSSGFGTKFTNPTQPARVYNKGLVLNSDNSKLIVASWVSPFIQVYTYNSSTGIGILLSNPATLPPGRITNAKLSTDEKIVSFSSQSSAFIGVYTWNNSTGLGTKYADPSTIPNSIYAINCAIGYTDANNYKIALGMYNNPNLYVYNFNIASGFGTASSDLIGSVSGYDNSGLAFANSGKNIVYGMGLTTSLRNVYLTGTSTYTFNQQTPPSVTGTSITDACFTSDSKFIAVSSNTSVDIYNYFDTDTFASSWGTRISNSLTGAKSIQLLTY